MIDRVPGALYDQAIADPKSAFSHPQDVVSAGGLSEQQKLELLNRWRQNELALVRASGEGMTGGEQPAIVQEVDKCIRELRGGEVRDG